eukprot:TRINITY_DN25218_c0_g1_i1.p1 TRINITY_DN25218_c0_g1~~TRINITY_DN25218_c0_g1_i1.p1  ORF type:complete len:376 (+),score=57.52 TRINITY_DN25218_c0_g1_i1:71-1198(+)
MAAGYGKARLAPLLDWPPPPSPAGVQRPGHACAKSSSAPAVGLGATSPEEAGSSEVTLARSAEGRRRSDLWEVRSAIEKEKLRHVLAYPFLGLAMRFQDESAALQITDDGRFSYSCVAIEGLEPGERPPSGEPQVQRVTTYEGVLTEPEMSDTSDMAPAFADPPVNDNGVASIEGKAMVKHEIEDSGGRTRLVSVVRGTFRFSISVSPYFQPKMCTVQPKPTQWPPLKKQLPYVGSGIQRKEYAIGTKSSMKLKAGDMTGLQQEHRRAPKLKFSMSENSPVLKNRSLLMTVGASSVQRPPSSSMLMREHHEEGVAMPRGDSRGGDGRDRRLSSAFSTPNLMADLEEKKNVNQYRRSTVTDWRDFYKARASRMIVG